ncbi:Hypothetical_protein [Hexamita inflata]|uniref:Hypothetical_protein n=1 Tax=Hexamita inflata TaxID=28002 RepID=A0AA86NL92_9EUKA|nr:Hypothetical protein HINF_LOCUS8824 [Hexamita inflata]
MPKVLIFKIFIEIEYIRLEKLFFSQKLKNICFSLFVFLWNLQKICITRNFRKQCQLIGLIQNQHSKRVWTESWRAELVLPSREYFSKILFQLSITLLVFNQPLCLLSGSQSCYICTAQDHLYQLYQNIVTNNMCFLLIIFYISFCSIAFTFTYIIESYGV